MRTNRNLSDLTKKRISDGVKRNHQSRGMNKKIQVSQKQSDAMVNYWRSIPKTETDTDNETTDDNGVV